MFKTHFKEIQSINTYLPNVNIIHTQRRKYVTQFHDTFIFYALLQQNFNKDQNKEYSPASVAYLNFQECMKSALPFFKASSIQSSTGCTVSRK